MEELAGRIDVALLPIAGWGPRLGPGHLNPQRAAEAAALIRPRVAIPIHWGTLIRRDMRRRADEFLARAGATVRRSARGAGAGVELALLEPGRVLGPRRLPAA